jgi:hypothetical protein
MWLRARRRVALWERPQVAPEVLLLVMRVGAPQQVQ